MESKVYYLKLKGSEHFIVYDGSHEDEEMKNCVSLSITGNINYATKYTEVEAYNHTLYRSNVVNIIPLSMKSTNVKGDYIQYSIFDEIEKKWYNNNCKEH